MTGTSIDRAADPGGPRAPEAAEPPSRLRAAGRVAAGRLDPTAAAKARNGEVSPVDALAALEELAGGATRPSGGLADQLLAFVTPRPRHPDTLRAPRIVPLLGAAASLLERGAAGSDDLAALGTAALGQELRQHRELAERRATLIEG